ncbi:MAG: SUMF1/EgtB/PvdO family nonheme iron enzyme [Flavobacteriales bacterium]|nr:SUMF1/EgtB/PvdO family nonheme iron enzyme [Flavobacteriales bacterium]MCB0782238.1 SUMF1/EgtB/PvdO family nonheme iron enzyme [Flavobacteriales bacterium]MCB0814105.1 SUMF1/EgtB/PvdO family nonheme iron enzyme [Flavobacteriales bacterium]
MSCNMWEWFQDWYGEKYYDNSPQRDPQGPSSGQYRVVRGGSWDNSPGSSRLADRSRLTPGLRSLNFGFRLARTEKYLVL